MSRPEIRSGIDLVSKPLFVEAALWRRYKIDGDASFRPAVFERYRRIALVLARSAWRRQPLQGLDACDYEQFAFQGLLEAIDRYDPLRGIPFEIYARHRIEGSIRDGREAASEAAAQGSFRRRLELERLRAVKAALKATDPADPLGEASRLITELALSLLLDEAGRDCRAEAHAPVEGADAWQSVDWRDLILSLKACVKALADPEGMIIRLHYFDGLPLARVAELAGLSPARISQLHQRALERIKAAL